MLVANRDGHSIRVNIKTDKWDNRSIDLLSFLMGEHDLVPEFKKCRLVIWEVFVIRGVVLNITHLCKGTVVVYVALEMLNVLDLFGDPTRDMKAR